MSKQISDTVAQASAQFAEWGRTFYPHQPGAVPSRLYAFLAERVGQDASLLSSLLAGRGGALPPSLPTRLFAAVRFLLLKRSEPHPLWELYPDLVPATRPLTEAGYDLFRAFCLKHADQLAQLVQTRTPALNDAGRCASLLPALCLVAQRNQDRPLAIVDIGSSAGLLLLWQRYAYLYPPEEDWRGEKSSSVRLVCRLEGDLFPPLPDRLPPVAWQQGIDLRPLDITDADDRLWLRALIWPERTDRLSVLEQAIQLAQKHPPVIHSGDASGEDLDRLLESVPLDCVLCVTHSYVLVHLIPERQTHFLERIAAQARQRTLYRISQEFYPGAPTPVLELFTYPHAGSCTKELLGPCDGFGQWLKWEGKRQVFCGC